MEILAPQKKKKKKNHGALKMQENAITIDSI